MRKSTAQANLTETKILQLEFWNKFKEHAQNKNSKLRLRKTSPQHWYDISIGNTDAHITLTINSQKNVITCEIYISDSKDLFYGLQGHRDKIENELGMKLEWFALEGKKASRIKLLKEADINETKNWEIYFEWLKENAEKFQKVFIKYIKKVQK